MRTRSFMTYRLPTRLDVPSIRVDFVPSYETTGPFGAKSIEEVKDKLISMDLNLKQ